MRREMARAFMTFEGRSLLSLLYKVFKKRNSGSHKGLRLDYITYCERTLRSKGFFLLFIHHFYSGFYSSTFLPELVLLSGVKEVILKVRLQDK